jgi:hypothetical protein
MTSSSFHRPLSRREWLRLSAAGVAGLSFSGWLETLARETGASPQRRRSCIVLWMSGGPSQTDTFDLKPGHANGGPFKEIATKVEGIRISEHLPAIAKFTDKMAIVRTMTTKEGDHDRASRFLHTGYKMGGPIEYPALGSLVAKELGQDDATLPNFVSISSYRIDSGSYGAGFLGPRYAPLLLGNTNPRPGGDRQGYEDALKVHDLDLPTGVSGKRRDAQATLLEEMEKEFVAGHPESSARGHQSAYDRAVRLMRTDVAKAFNLEEEKESLRDAYGRNLFGQGCLLARRLIENDVPFVEVALNGLDGQAAGWDTHGDNFERVKQLSGVLDPAWATLMSDLQDRGMLDSTLIVWMGEFGRTPVINNAKGRDHFPNAWSSVLAGGGIRGGQVVGRTSEDGTTIEERPVTGPDFLATVCKAIGIDPAKQNTSNTGRPIRIIEKGAKPIGEVLAGN